jgi:hypothetical protein
VLEIYECVSVVSVGNIVCVRELLVLGVLCVCG